MADVVSKKKRSLMMAGIKGKNTKPEVAIRKELFKKGYRYRLHRKDLPGKPDMVFTKYNTVVFVHGCFWHMHNCHLFKYPSTRPEFWHNKLNGNKERDQKHIKELRDKKWRILIIWECAWKGKYKRPLDEITKLAASFFESDLETMQIENTKQCPDYHSIFKE